MTVRSKTGVLGKGTPRVLTPWYQFIQNAAAVLLPQRLITQFTGGGVAISDDAANNRTIVNLAAVEAAAVILFGAGNTLSTPGARWLFPGFADAMPLIDDTARAIVPRAGTLRNMYVMQNVTSVGAETLTYTLFVDGVASALTVTLGESASSGSNTVNAVTVAAAAQLSMRVTKSGAIGVAVSRPVVAMGFAG